jgi:site-specific DNA recombinase
VAGSQADFLKATLIMPRTAAIGYVRVSTTQQAEQGVSVAAQSTRIKAQARALGLRLVEIVADKGASGKSLSRPGAQRVMQAVADGTCGAVVVWKLDRLTRSVRDLLGLLDLLAKHEVRLISITEAFDTESAVGRMVVTILGAVAQMEREQIGERIRMAAQYVKGSGRVWGAVPWGFARKGKQLIPNGSEKAICRYVVCLRAKGLTYAQIADRLNCERKWYPRVHRCKKGKRQRCRLRTRREWRHQHVYRIVTAWAKRLGIKMPAAAKSAPRTVAGGYRTDGHAHRQARMKVPAWHRRQIAQLGAMARHRSKYGDD